jgi:hypothetical protein
MSALSGLTPTVLRSRPPFPANTVGALTSAARSANVNVIEAGNGIVRASVFQFNNSSVTMTDATTNGAHGSLALYDFPEGVISIDGVVGSLTLARVGTNLTATAAVVAGLGTAAVATDNATLLGAEADIFPSTAVTLASGSATFSPRSLLTASIAALTDNSGGTASDTIAAIGATYVQAEVRNAVASLASKINAVMAAVSGRSVVFNGTTTPIDLFLNFAVPDAGSTGNDALLLNGTLVVTWKHLGDN